MGIYELLFCFLIYTVIILIQIVLPRRRFFQEA
jgi:hypothetical protein